MASNIFYVATLCNPVNAGSMPDVIYLAFLTNTRVIKRHFWRRSLSAKGL
jgi:hypothetical protein